MRGGANPFPPTHLMNINTIIWEKIKKKREGYYIEYQPPRYDPDATGYPLAVLCIVILAQFSKEKTALILENEFKTWASLYTVALMAMAWDEAENRIDLSTVRPSDSITGFYNPSDKQITLHWGLLENDQIPDSLKQKERLKEIYGGVPFKTGKQIKEEVEQHYKGIRFGKRIIIAALIIPILFPVAIEIWGFSNPIISALTLIYSLVIAGMAILKLLGMISPSRKEIEKSKTEQKMKHYYYHCEMNPTGFLRLKNENFEREAREQIKKDYEDLS